MLVVFHEEAALHIVSRPFMSSRRVSEDLTSPFSLSIKRCSEAIEGRLGDVRLWGIYTLHFVFMGLSSVWVPARQRRALSQPTWNKLITAFASTGNGPRLAARHRGCLEKAASDLHTALHCTFNTTHHLVTINTFSHPAFPETCKLWVLLDILLPSVFHIVNSMLTRHTRWSWEADCETERRCDMQEDSKGASELL